jgi:hypothetical protein
VFVVFTVDLDIFRLEAIVSGGNTNPPGNLSFTKKDVGLMDVWELNPEK